ncbi:MAG: GAF domain-containing sensor histidine kinase [Bacteriovoracaceae bacterium]|nr:GAF domain-containing sensor histidine kinase [Bacteriovoracaceae bacterium]
MSLKNKDQYIQSLKKLCEVSSNRYQSLDVLCKSYIDLGRDILGMDTGIVSHISDDRYRIVWSESSMPGLEKNVQFKLGETYCSAVIDKKDIVAYNNVGRDPNMKNHPVYVNANLESYIGYPIIVNNRVYGTLNFSDTRTRTPLFDEYDLNMMTLISTALGNAIDYFDTLQTREDFISIVNHELRTPITSLTGSLKLLNDFTKDKLDKDSRDLLDISLRNIDHLLELVTDILDYEKFALGTVIPQLEEVSVKAILENTINNIKGYALNHSSTVQIRGEVPPVTIKVDKKKILQVMLNLTTNALKFSPENSEVWLEVEEEDSGVYIKVIDSGFGIPKDKLEVIFDSFTQIDSTDARQQGGTGLGLAICKRIIDIHGGEIGAKNNKNKGSTFYIYLKK